jgi:acyl carrier protein
LDDQVKIRGFRIELGEIEAVLGQHAAVQQTVVMAREDIPGNPSLVAYLVTTQDPAPTSAEWRQFLRQKLPDYMLPATFVWLEALPLTLNGKVDRSALPAPERTRSELANTYVEARTPVEEKLTEIVAQLLGVEKMGIYDNFFELGGHSLLATQAMSRIRAVFEVTLSLRHLFETPTVAGLAERIETIHWVVQGAAMPPKTEVDDREEGEL